MRSIRRAGLAALVALGVSSGAQAATLDLAGGVLTYTAAVGAVNQLSASLGGGIYLIDDPGEASITIGSGAAAAGCANVDANTVSCPRAAISSWNVQLADQSDTANLVQVLEPITFRGGPGNDNLNGGQNADTFLWSPGDNNDAIEGSLGADALSFSGSNSAENISVFLLLGDGFRVTRDIGNVSVDAFRVESLTIQALGGDDVLNTIPLATTLQIFDGGGQSLTDTLTYNALGLCTIRAPGWLESPGGQPVNFTGFETVSITNSCANPIPLPLSLRVMLASLLGIAVIWSYRLAAKR